MGELLLMTEIGGRRAAIPSAQVQSVVELDHIVPVPRAPDFVAGLTALRSRALTVVDARKALGIGAAAEDADCRAAVVEVEGHAYAILVDRVEDVVEAASEPDRPDATLGGDWNRVSLGMIETAIGPAVLVDIATLVAGPDREVTSAA